nr:MAG TPA: hypothetical protein [Caudoviricetes sp.]
MFFWCVNTVAYERLFYFQKSKLFYERKCK